MNAITIINYENEVFIYTLGLSLYLSIYRIKMSSYETSVPSNDVQGSLLGSVTQDESRRDGSQVELMMALMTATVRWR